MTRKEFIEKWKLTLACGQVSSNPHNADPNWKAFHWACRIEANGKKPGFDLVFSKGLAHQGFRVKQPDGQIVWRRATDREINRDRDSTFSRIKPIPPTLDEVLECLQSDFDSLTDGVGYEDWAESLGYDPDSREGEKIYETVIGQYHEFRKALSGQCIRELATLDRD